MTNGQQRQPAKHVLRLLARGFGLLAVFLLAYPAWGQMEVETFSNVAMVKIKTEYKLDDCLVKLKSATCNPIAVSKDLYVVSEPGTHAIDVNVVNFKNGTWDDQLIQVVVGEVQPQPDPEPEPDEPDIEPEPEPDDPEPDPEPETLTNLKVLVVYESGDLSAMPTAQSAVMFSKKSRDYLKQIDAEYRQLDPDAEFADPSDPYKVLLGRERDSLPWMIIAGDEGIGYEGPLSPNVEAFLRTLDQYKAKQKPAPESKPTEAAIGPIVPVPDLVELPIERRRTPIRSAIRSGRWEPFVVGFQNCSNGTCQPVYEYRWVTQ